MNVREIALEILNKTIIDESYTSLLMRRRLKDIPSINRPFVSELVYGTLRNYNLLLYQIKDDVKDNTKLKLKQILALALYERFFMNTKDYALVNEYVELATNKYDKAFINAILRKNNELKYANDMAVDNSLPVWIINLLKSQYKEELNEILDIYKTRAITYYRINPHKTSFNDLKELKIKQIDDRYFTSELSLINSKEFKEGLFYVQDYNSSKIVDSLDLKEDSLFLDMCCAPGTKLFNALDIVKDSNCYANDLYENRVKLIKDGAKRLGYNNIHYLTSDATELYKLLDIKFNRILLDAPCSGLGVISRRPDIKFHIKPESLDQLQAVQSQLLDSAYSLLDKDGILVYSTCTLNKKENAKHIERFINNHDDMALIKEETIIKKGGDCFYLAKLKKL